MPRSTRSRKRPVDGIRRAATLIIAMAGFPLVTWPALADEGSVRLLWSLVRDYTTVDHGGVQITGGSSTGTVSVLESSGGPFVEGAVGIGTCVLLARTSESDVDLEAPCSMTDREADSLYIMTRRNSGDVLEGGGQGRLELLGGSGKYAGLDGACSYDLTYLPGDHLVAVAECTWHRDVD